MEVSLYHKLGSIFSLHPPSPPLLPSGSRPENQRARHRRSVSQQSDTCWVSGGGTLPSLGPTLSLSLVVVKFQMFDCHFMLQSSNVAFSFGCFSFQLISVGWMFLEFPIFPPFCVFTGQDFAARDLARVFTLLSLV